MSKRSLKKLVYTGHRPLWFGGLGHVKPGDEVRVSEEKAKSLLNTKKFKAATAAKEEAK